MGRLEGKRIVITGAGSGMGRAFAVAFAQHGAAVGVLDRSLDAARSVSAEIGEQAVALHADVSSRSQVADALDRFAGQVAAST